MLNAYPRAPRPLAHRAALAGVPRVLRLPRGAEQRAWLRLPHSALQRAAWACPCASGDGDGATAAELVARLEVDLKALETRRDYRPPPPPIVLIGPLHYEKGRWTAYIRQRADAEDGSRPE